MKFARAIWKLLVGIKDALVLIFMLLFFGFLYVGLSARPDPVGEGGSERLELVLASEDVQALGQTAQRLVRELRALGTLSNINSTASAERQEIVIRPDLQRAAERGVTTEAIGDVVRIATSGDFDAQVGRLNLDNRQIFIRTRMADEARRDLSALANLRVAGRDGVVALESIADISLASDLSRIDRYDRKRFVGVTADLNGMAEDDAMAQVEMLPAIRAMPSTVSLLPEGDAEIGEDISAGFLTALAAGILCIYCVLVLLFRDFFQPVTILSALPLSIGGAFLALFLSGSTLVLTAMIGLVMLMGIVAKNSILLVEYAILGIKSRGLSREEALLEACRADRRWLIRNQLQFALTISELLMPGYTPHAYRLDLDFDAVHLDQRDQLPRATVQVAARDLAVHLAGQGGLGQARADGGGDVGHADGVLERPLAAVGKGDRDHGRVRKIKKDARRPSSGRGPGRAISGWR
mgnify:CR=1 FL=1